jgi:hypothetical protein
MPVLSYQTRHGRMWRLGDGDDDGQRVARRVQMTADKRPDMTVETRPSPAPRLEHQPTECANRGGAAMTNGTHRVKPADPQAQAVPVEAPMTGRASARTPNVARIYDFLLGGKDNYEEDRRAAEQLLDAVPDAAVAAWDNREFLGRAVRFLVEEAGIRQFIDIGTGLPTRSSVHTVAQQLTPEVRVAYVDYDPIVVAHARALLAQYPNVIAIEGDLREAGHILANTALRTLIDFREPVAILLVAVLHFIRDGENPHEIVDMLKSAMVPGSYLVLSHVTGDDIPPEAAEQARKLYEKATAPGVTRTRAEVMSFFEHLKIVPPGLVNVASWRTDWMAAEPGRTIFYAGVGAKHT